jgi:hypothetical protein
MSTLRFISSNQLVLGIDLHSPDRAWRQLVSYHSNPNYLLDIGENSPLKTAILGVIYALDDKVPEFAVRAAMM